MYECHLIYQGKEGQGQGQGCIGLIDKTHLAISSGLTEDAHPLDAPIGEDGDLEVRDEPFPLRRSELFLSKGVLLARPQSSASE